MRPKWVQAEIPILELNKLREPQILNQFEFHTYRVKNSDHHNFRARNEFQQLATMRTLESRCATGTREALAFNRMQPVMVPVRTDEL